MIRRKLRSPRAETVDPPLPKKVTHYELCGVRGHDPDNKAAQLLWDHLNNEQKWTLLSQWYFEVHSGQYTFQFYFKEGLTRYRYKGGFMRSVCIQCYDLPRGDQLLALKLMAEADPKQFLKIAKH